MTADTDFDTAVLMARLKLNAKKQLGVAVDLEQLETDPVYASAVLRAIEEEAEDENLLVLVVRLRAKMAMAGVTPVSKPAASVAAPKVVPKPTQLLRDHRFGARG